MSSKRLIVLWFVASMFTTGASSFPAQGFSRQRISELTESLDDLLVSSDVPGLSVVLVGPDEDPRFISLGKADLDSGVWIGPDTRFRLGELSETFLALGLLRLAADGKLEIDERVDRQLPELAITNDYARRDPIRLDQLMEQTAGLEDMPLSEYARRQRSSETLLQTLKRNEAHLLVRWRPGVYVLSSSLGTMLAARILEETSGREFSQWMTQEVLHPLGLESVYLRDRLSVPQQDLATGYLPDGSPVLEPGGADLWPVLGLEASARDLGKLLRLMLARGTLNGAPWLAASAIERMEAPLTSLAARQGLRVENGFGVRTSLSSGFVFYGFQGNGDGTWACFRYLPGDGVGYALLMNGGSRQDFEAAQERVNEACTRDLRAPQPLFSDLPEYRIAAVSGYYRPVTPRWAWLNFWDRIRGVLYLRNTIGKVEVDRLAGPTVQLFPVTDRRFRAEGEPLPTVLFFRAGQGRAGLEAFSEYLQGNYLRASGLLVWLERIEAGLVLLLSVGWIVAILWRLVRAALGRAGARIDVLLILFPSLALISLAAAAAPFAFLQDTFVRAYGVASIWSVGFFLLTLLFAALVLASIVVVLMKWKLHDQDRLWHLAAVLSSLYLLVLIYAAYWGVIGLRTWQA